MRILFFLILQISFWATSFAQKDIVVLAEDEAAPKFSFTYTFGAGFQSSSTDRASYISGLYVDYKIYNKIQVGSGLFYYVLNSDFNATIEEFEMDDYGNLFNSKSILPRSAKYLEVPLNLSYRKKKRQFTIGVSNMLFLRAKGFEEEFDRRFFNFFPSTPLIKIEPHGFRKYHINGHLSGSFYTANGIGFMLKVFKPLTDLAEPAREIPSGNTLFPSAQDRKPGGFSIHLLYQFPRIGFFK